MKKNTLNLLIWEHGQEQCEQHINTLKNSGFAVRERLIKNSEALQSALSERSWDILIVNTGAIDQPALTLQQQISIQQPNLITSYLHSTEDCESIYALYTAGATQVIEPEQIKLLEVLLPRVINCHTLQGQLYLAQQKIEEEQQRNRILMDSSRDAIAYIQDGMHAYTNTSYVEMFHIDEQDELESTPLLDLIDTASRDEIKNILRQFSRQELTHTTLDCTAIRDNQALKVSIDFTEALLDGEPSVQLVIQDQSYDVELSQKLEELSNKDLVTNLSNRSHFIEQLKSFMASDTEQEKPSHAILFIKLDNYSELQQQLGIAGYDVLLRDITDIIQPILKDSNNLARFSDEIFTSRQPIHPDIRIDDLAQNVCNAIAAAHLVVDGTEVTTSVSIGISPIENGQHSVEKILVDVERACNSAHEAGGNQVKELHNLASVDTLQSSCNTVAIKKALKENNFRLVFQPIVSLHASPGGRYQVLLRMIDDKGEEIAPGEFLPTAEKEAGLMKMIDRWVIVNSINNLIKQRQQNKKVQLFIKLSEESLLDPATIKWISKYLHDSRIPGDNLVFELNQEHVLKHKKESETFINMINQLHCLTAIGHILGLLESIDYLAHLNTHFLKIDGLLISSLANDNSSQEITKKIAALAQANNKQTIAEFVHDANTLAVLWQHGINFVQGHYLQQPDHEMNYNFED